MKKFFIALTIIFCLAPQAFASGNPFADVPSGHWAYDSLEFLASRGVVSGYSRGRYAGGKTATRYELACLTARALEKIDTTKASRDSLELLGKLASEFRSELESLNVDTSKLGRRVAGLEAGQKGVILRASIWFDSDFIGSDNMTTEPKFSYGRTRFFLEKQVDENTFFQMRTVIKTMADAGDRPFVIDRLWFSSALGRGLVGTFGYQVNDWDKEYELYNGIYCGWGFEGAFWTDTNLLGADVRRDFGKFDLDLYLGSASQKIGTSSTASDFTVGGVKAGYKSEKLKLGVFARHMKFAGTGSDPDITNYGVYARYMPLPDLELKGTFNHQKRSEATGIFDETDANYWQVVAEAKQSLLKVGSLWVQYGRVGKGFLHGKCAFNSIGAGSLPLANFISNLAATQDYSFFKVALLRKFSPKFDACAIFQRFGNLSDKEIDATTDYCLALRYQYTPSIAFILHFDLRDYGSGNAQGTVGRENFFRFRTAINL